MPSTAPSAAPDEAPRMSGETSGLRNRPWNAVPATASAPPTSTAATTRGPRTSSTTFSTAGGTAVVRPMSRETRTSVSSASVTGYRPTVNATRRPSTSTPSAMRRPGRKRRVMSAADCYVLDEYGVNRTASIPARQHPRDLRLARRDVVKARVKLLRARAQILGEQIRVQDFRKPPQADQPVHRRGEIDPTERQLRGEMHPVRAHGGNRRPGRIARNIRREILVDGDDHIGIPQQHLLDRDVGEPAARAACDVLRDELDRLHIDRAAEPGLEPARPAGVVDARPSVGRDRAHTLRDGFHRVFGVARKALALLAPPDQCAERAVAQRNALETAVEQCVGNARLLLHAVGERDVGRIHAADIEDEIGFEREHDFEIGGIAAPGDAAHFGPVADIGQEEFALLRPVGAWPADEQFGRERVEKDRGRWSRRKDALDTRRHRHGAAGAVGHARGARAPCPQQARRETCNQRAAIVGHHTPIMTSDALMTAQASSPVLRLRSATASFVIEDVMTMPLPISIRTWDVVAPFLTSTILPLSWLRALSFFMAYSFQKFVLMARCRRRCARHQRLSPSAPRNDKHLNCLFDGALKRAFSRASPLLRQRRGSEAMLCQHALA